MRAIFAHRTAEESDCESPPASRAARRSGLRHGRRVCLLAAAVLCCGVTAAAATAPVIISEPTSTRAVAVSPPNFQPQPFPLTCAEAICQGQRTRVMLFVMGLALQPGDAASAVTARAEDGTHRFYDLTVEHVGPVSGYEWMSAVVLKLGDDMGDVGDVLVGLKYRGADSNRVRIGIGRLGGGPADDAGALPTPAPPFSIGGFARDGLAGLGGVSVSVGGASVASLVTGADGSFALGNLPAGGRYTLTPSKPCYTFSPVSFVVESLYRNTSVNFAGAENRIDGRVLDADGQPIAAVSIALGAAQPGAAQTDAAGAFSFACLTPGDYTVTPAHAHYNFAPASLPLGALAGRRTADFTGTLKQFTVRGRITRPDGAGLAGVAVTLSGSQSGATTTDASGDYTLAGLRAGGSYTLTPTLANHTLAPPARTFANLSGDETADFVGTLNTHTISGRVSNTSNNGLAGVTVTLSSAQSGTTQTDAAGNYSFNGLPAGGDYTVTPSLSNYTFAPAARAFNNLSADQTADFTDALNTHTLSGRVANASNNPLAGVTVTLSGTRSGVVQTDAGGNYSFTNLPAGGTYAVTPALVNYTFAPASRNYNGLTSDQAGDFTGTLNTFQIAGRVSDSANNSLPGVTVTLSGAQSATATTGVGGNYSFANLPTGGNYTVSPSLTNYTFAPPNRTFNGLAANQTADFAGVLNTHVISGRVSDAANNPLAGVSVALSGSRVTTATTDATGNYTFASLPAAGSYSVTPSLANYTFAPPGRAFDNLTANQTGDFAATLNTHTISGRVTAGATALAGATLTLTGSQSATATADAGGNYSFGGLAAGGNYTVTPTLTNYTFAPASRAFNNLTANQAGDFAATLNTHAVSGRIIVGSSSNGLAGVTVALTGAQSGTTQTDAAGNYSFNGLPAGGNYTVTPSLVNYTFAPASRSFNALASNQSGDFTGTLNTFAVAGRVTSGANGLAGVTVTLSGSQSATTQTDAAGNYSFASLPAGNNYAVTPALAHYTFAPPSRAFNNLSANQTGDFAATLNTHTISGRIADANNTALANVAVALAGTRNAATTTDAAGNYSFVNLDGGGNYTLTATLKHHTFAPATRAFNNLSANQTADFTGTLNTHAIGGRVLEAGGAGLAGVSVNLSGTRVAATATDAGGNYSFASLPAGGNYTVAASKTQYDLAPASRAYTDLGSDQTADFAAALSRYTISGRLTTPEGVGIGGATVTLAGGTTRTFNTAADGLYSFDGVIAKGNYTVSASRVNYDFSPTGRAFPDLGADQTANFTGVIHRFNISGRVTAGGQPLASIHVALTGSQTATTFADAGGNYSFSLPAKGDYTITPSPRHFYAYTPPARSFVNLAADSVADFSAAPVAPPATQRVLEWDGSPKTVDYNYFFLSPTDFGHFFWEFWAMPGQNAGATYLLSDGYGGAHALLFGFGSFGTSEAGRYQFIGNVWNGAGYVNFNSEEGPAVGEWGHFAVGWDGQEIITYLNGVPVGRSPFAGPRREAGFNNGGGRLLIGGSDHSNLVGRIAQVRGFENVNPREDPSGLNPARTRAAYAPDTVFRTGGQMLSNYFESLQTVADLSTGFQGELHPGRLRGTPYPYGLLAFCEECPRPQYVVDPSAPDFATATDRSQRTFNPPPAPAGALVYDTFSRRNSTHALGAGGLGQTESGSAGRLTWQSVPSLPQGAAFGILNERAVVLADRRALAWVTLPPASLSAGHELSVRRRNGARAAGLDTGLAFRVADADNHFFAYTTGDDNSPHERTLTIGYYQNGQRTELAAGLPVAGGWTVLSVVTSPGGAIRVYADSTLIYSTTHGLFAGATGAGLYNDGPGLGLANRWDDFAASDAAAQ